MRIVWHMPRLHSHTCGLSKRAARLARELAARGHEVSFVVPADRTDLTDGVHGIPVARIQFQRRSPIHWSLQGRCRLAEARRVVAKIDSPHECLITCQPEAVSAYRSFHAEGPVIFVCGGTTILHDVADQSRPIESGHTLSRIAYSLDRAVRRRSERTAFHAADAVVFDSESTRSVSIPTYRISPSRCHAIYGAIDAAEFSPPDPEQRVTDRKTLEIRDDEFVIVWTGRLAREKNVGRLIDAVSQCKSHGIRLFIAGHGDEAEALRQTASLRGVADRVRFINDCNDVRPFLHAADLFVFPSVGESFGLSLAEAMACGLPCIAIRPNGRSVCNASPELLDNGRAGLLIDHDDSTCLAEAIDRLCANPELRRTLGSAAAARARELFTWSGAGDKLNEIVADVVHTKRRNPRGQDAPGAVALGGRRAACG